MIGPHPAQFRLLAAALFLASPAVWADPDLPGAAANVELIPSGSLVIAMDNTNQSLVAPFNLTAYGLVNALLWEKIPVKWAIRAGKAKDGIDFSGTAQRILPTATAAAPYDFRGGPFIVHRDWATYARVRMAAYGNQVAVYELTADVLVDVRYTLDQKRKVGALDDGGNAAIHTAILAAAGFTLGTHYEVVATATSVTINAATCYTTVTEPHWNQNPPGSDPQVQAVRQFLLSGGNFLGQCEGLMTYENNPTHGRFQTTAGLVTNNLSQAFLYPGPDLPYSQFQGNLANVGGSVRDYRLAGGSAFQNNGHLHVQNTPTTTAYAASASKFVSPGTGTMVFYLGGHNYNGGTLEEYNGRRMYLNAVMTPAVRPAGCDFSFPVDPAVLRTISGSVFEDVNGDAALGDAVAVNGVRVRVYADSNASGIVDAGDTFIAETTTAGAGAYSVQVHSAVTGVLYLVTVDSKTVAPAAGFNGGSGQGDVWAEQTYGDDPATALLDLGPRFGGRNPSVSDAVSAASTVPASNNYQHLARVDVSGGNVVGVNFALSFNVVTHTRGGDATDDDAGANRTIQGGVRQFIQNANAIQLGNAMRFVPAVPTNASSGPHAWWRVSVSTDLPPLTNAGTAIDGRAYSAADGSTLRNDNGALQGAGGTVGTDGLSLPRRDPELEFLAVGTRPIGLDLQAASSTVRAVAIYGFGDASDSDTRANIRVGNFLGALIEDCVVGTGAASFTDPAVAAVADGIRVVGGDGGEIRNSLIGFHGGSGVGFATGSNGWTLTGNELRGNAKNVTTLAGVKLTSSSGATLRGNLFYGNKGAGLDMPGSTGGHTIENNSATRNGIGQAVTPGLRIVGSASVVDRNVLYENFGAGAMVASSAALNRLTRNSIYDNGTIVGDGGGPVSGQIGIDLLRAADNANTGTAPFFTLNDPGDPDAGGNGLLNFPTLTFAGVGGGSTTVSGSYAGGASTTFTLEFFGSPAGDPSGFGEGRTYLGSGPVTTDLSGNGTFSVTLPAVAVGSVVTATATSPGGDTSEFSGAVTVTALRSLVKRAFQADGTPIPDGSSLPAGLPVRFLLYIDNSGGAAADVSVNDVLDPTFAYVSGSIKVDNALLSAATCPGGVCDEAAIFAKVDGAPNVCGSFGFECTDLPDADVVSFAGVTLDAGNGSVPGNAQLDIPAGRVWALLFSVTIQ